MSLRDSVTFAGVMRDAHRLTGHLAIWTALLAAVLIAVEPLRRNRLVRSIVLGATLFLVVLVSSFTGYLLPWDQLALWAVTVGTDMRGYAVLRDHQVWFVLLGGRRSEPARCCDGWASTWSSVRARWCSPPLRGAASDLRLLRESLTIRDRSNAHLALRRVTARRRRTGRASRSA